MTRIDDRDTIARLRALEAEATPGPWTFSEWEDGVVTVDRVHDDGLDPVAIMAAGTTDSDAALTAASRNALPALLDVAEAARAFRDGTYAGGRAYSGGDLIAALARLEAPGA